MRIANLILFLISSSVAMNVFASREQFDWALTNTTNKPIHVEYFAATGKDGGWEFKCVSDHEHPVRTILISAKSTKTVFITTRHICLKIAGTNKMSTYGASFPHLYYPNTECYEDVGDFCPFEPRDGGCFFSKTIG